MPHTHVKFQVSDHVAELTIARPTHLNALDHDALSAIDDSFSALESRGDIRAVVMTGEGRAFVSGGDIAYMSRLDDVGAREFIRLGQKVLNHLEKSPLPVIAAINGFAFGGGFELALACDLRMAAQDAVLGLPEVSLGIVPAFGGTQRLVELCGYGIAKELILTGRHVDAKEALSLGLVNSVHAKDQLLPAARAKAALISSRAPMAVSLAKGLVTKSTETGQSRELDAFSLCMAHEDSREGLQAFVAGRAPVWGKPTG